MFDVPVEIPPAGEYVADGAARQAAWVLSGADDAPNWSGARVGDTLRFEPAPAPIVMEAYSAARRALYP
jgi:xylulokinase